MINQIELKKILKYEPGTGMFTWLNSKSKKIKTGDAAGAVKYGGYLGIKIAGLLYRSDNLAVLYMTGALPGKSVEHKNQNLLDNAWDNLTVPGQAPTELLSEPWASFKKGLRTTEFKDVHKVGNKFRAEAIVNGKIYWLALFNTPELAKASLTEFNKKYH
jgi:hypothetical protein